MIIFKIILCIILLVVIPFGMGLLALKKFDVDNRTLGMILPVGYVSMLVIFELVTVPILLTTHYQNFKYVCWIYTPIILALSIWGICTGAKQVRCDIYKPQDTDAKIMWILAAVILCFMLFMAETRVIFDGDDAFYVTQSLITQQTGTMYSIQPYTGRAADVDIRHALAVFPMWIAYIGKLTGIHTTIICHTVLPLVVIPLSLFTYAELAIRVLGKRKNELPYFVVFMELLYVFGRVSIYTAETFLLTRTWQGKALAGNFLIPMAFLAACIFFAEQSKSRWILFVLVSAGAGVFSSLAIVLVSILILAAGLLAAIYEKRWKTFLGACFCCIPGGIYMIIYLYYTYFGWR